MKITNPTSTPKPEPVENKEENKEENFLTIVKNLFLDILNAIKIKKRNYSFLFFSL